MAYYLLLKNNYSRIYTLEQLYMVFNPKIGKYNDASGKVRASVNMGSTEPPPKKGRLPFYNRKNLEELQEWMDEVEAIDILSNRKTLESQSNMYPPVF